MKYKIEILKNNRLVYQETTSLFNHPKQLLKQVINDIYNVDYYIALIVNENGEYWVYVIKKNNNKYKVTLIKKSIELLSYDKLQLIFTGNKKLKEVLL